MQAGTSPPTTTTAKEGPPPTTHSSAAGVGYVLLGTFSFSIMFFLVKLLPEGFSTFIIVFYRSMYQAALALVFLARNRESPLGPRHLWFPLFLRGFFGALAVWAFFFAVQGLPLPTAVTLQFTIPVFSAALAAVFVGERWLPPDMIGAVVCLVGVMMIVRPAWLFGEDPEAEVVSNASQAMHSLAVMTGLIGAMCGGAAYVSVRYIGEGTSAYVMVVWYALVSSVLCPPALKLTTGSWNVVAVSSWHDFIVLSCCGISGFGGQYYTNRGLQLETAATATLVTNSQIVFAYLYELLFLHEPMTAWGAAGSGIITLYMVVVGATKMWADRRREPYQPITEKTGLSGAAVAVTDGQAVVGEEDRTLVSLDEP